MDLIKRFIDNNPKLQRFAKPLEAASVCDIARTVANGRFEIISYSEGLLRLGVKNPNQSMELQAESSKIIQEINRQIGEEIIKKLLFKVNR